MTEPLRLLMMSDLHFGHRRVPQDEMIAAFKKTVFPLLPTTDALFINGDFFDTLVAFDHFGFDPVYEMVIDLLRLCEEHRIVFRLLQGTFEHDRHQCRRFHGFYRATKCTFDFRHVEEIDVEEIDVRGRFLRIGYVPDSLPFKTSDDIVDVVKAKMKERDWDYLDYACMHGLFDFTFPAGISQENYVVFSEAQFPFVRKAINVGHVHHPKIKGKAISNGSFDRLNHGEEHAKGCIEILDYPDHYTAKFIENKNTAIFKTLAFASSDTTQDIRLKIKGYLGSIDTDREISLRFHTADKEQRSVIHGWMRETYPDINLAYTSDITSKIKPLTIPSDLMVTSEHVAAPTPSTISAFIRSYIDLVDPEYPLTIEQIEMYLSQE